MVTTMFCCYLLSLVMMLTNGQAYHFSQGWLPGGKRSLPAVVDDISGGSTGPLARLVRAEYKRRTAVRKSIDDYRPIVSNHGQHRTGLLKLVCSSIVVKPALQLIWDKLIKMDIDGWQQ